MEMIYAMLLYRSIVAILNTFKLILTCDHLYCIFVIYPIETIFIENETVRTKEILKGIQIKSLLQNTAIKRL